MNEKRKKKHPSWDQENENLFPTSLLNRKRAVENYDKMKNWFQAKHRHHQPPIGGLTMLGWAKNRDQINGAMRQKTMTTNYYSCDDTDNCNYNNYSYNSGVDDEIFAFHCGWMHRRLAAAAAVFCCRSTVFAGIAIMARSRWWRRKTSATKRCHEQMQQIQQQQ